MVNWESQSKTPPRVRKTDTFIVFYLFVLHFVTCLKTCHFAACFMSLRTFVSVFYANTARDVVTVLLIFANYLSLYLHIFTCTYRGTHTQAHMQNQHTRGKLCGRPCTDQKKMSGKTDIHESKEKIRAHRASSKATRLCLTK